MKNQLVAIFLAFLSLFLITNSAIAAPHFQLQMENRSDKDATITFLPVSGTFVLSPTLADNTTIKPHSISTKYEVSIEKIELQNNFNIAFTGKQSCIFNLSYYAPGNPKITISGSGCRGGGYELRDNGFTLLLFISDIRKKS